MRAPIVLTLLAIVFAGCASPRPTERPPTQSSEAFEAYCRAHGKVARYTPAGDVYYVQECVAHDAPEKPGSITVP